MTGELDPLAAVRASEVALDALAAGAGVGDDPGLGLLADLRAAIDAAVASTTDPRVRRDAALLDALATGRVLPGGDEALGLLHALRAAVDGVTTAEDPVPVPGQLPAPVPALAITPLAAGRGRRRLLRTGVAAGSVALALSMSGVAAAAYSSHPGGSLYGLRTQTFGRTDDDPVAAVDALATARQQLAVALKTPTDTSAAAKARAAFSRAKHDIAAEHDPVAQQSIAAAASSVETTLAVLPAPAAAVTTRSPRASASALAGRRFGGNARRATPGAAPAGAPSTPVAPSTARSPEASAGAAASPVASVSAAPSGTPSASGSPAGTPSASASGSPAATDSASAQPSDTGSASASPTDSPAVAATTARPVVTYYRPAPVRSARPKAKTRKKKSVTATLMTAQLPSAGLPPR